MIMFEQEGAPFFMMEFGGEEYICHRANTIALVFKANHVLDNLRLFDGIRPIASVYRQVFENSDIDLDGLIDSMIEHEFKVIQYQDIPDEELDYYVLNATANIDKEWGYYAGEA